MLDERRRPGKLFPKTPRGSEAAPRPVRSGGCPRCTLRAGAAPHPSRLCRDKAVPPQRWGGNMRTTTPMGARGGNSPRTTTPMGPRGGRRRHLGRCGGAAMAAGRAALALWAMAAALCRLQPALAAGERRGGDTGLRSGAGRATTSASRGGARAAGHARPAARLP